MSTSDSHLGSPRKRQLQRAAPAAPEQYQYQHQLSTLGMRIRQAVDNGYRAPQDPVRAAVPHTVPAAACVQDNTMYTIPDYKRVPLAADRAPPMLVNQRTVSSTSSLQAWESQLDERLSLIDSSIMHNKLGAGEFMLGGTKRAFDQLETDNW
ncbi:AaceriAER122Cp [[Ashbya] aceris (nom. inval.)]|nr:AaceriAER122Cp [[Ashbya] aceris (nom. inval.)]